RRVGSAAFVPSAADAAKLHRNGRSRSRCRAGVRAWARGDSPSSGRLDPRICRWQRGSPPSPRGILHPPSGAVIHHFPPGPANEPSQISDFRGLVANSRVTGSGIGVDMNTGAETPLTFQLDMGIMDGLYIGQDDRRHGGVFAFI